VEGRTQRRSESDGQQAVASAPCPGEGWRVIDLCCGLGGISLAAQDLGCEITAGVDISDIALQTFKRHFPEARPIKGSITSRKTISSVAKLVADSKPRVRTLIVSGPPCQGFSAAGARVQRDPRNRVLAAVGRAIACLRPDAALIENVAAILGERHRASVRRFLGIIKSAGYNASILRLNASEYGVPQTRHRVIFLITKYVLDEKELQKFLAKFRTSPVSVREALAGLMSPPVYKEAGAEHEKVPHNHVAMRHSERVRQKILAICPGTGPMSYRRLHPDKPARTLISGNRAPPAHFEEPRSITVREAARLQGFPDDFVVLGCFSNQMQLVTNAVPPPLARVALLTLFHALETSHGQVNVASGFAGEADRRGRTRPRAD